MRMSSTGMQAADLQAIPVHWLQAANQAGFEYGAVKHVRLTLNDPLYHLCCMCCSAYRV
jgi:hypothetical protein